MIESRVLDISRYQKTFDAALAKRQGINGIMARGGYGFGQDDRFVRFAEDAHAAGLAVGSYLFATWHYHSVSPSLAYAKANALAQAKSFINILKQAPVDSFTALDLELENGQTCNLSRQELSECANLFLDMLSQNGYRPLLYCSCSWLLEKKIEEHAIRCPFWIACYHCENADFSSQPADKFPPTQYGEKMAQLGNRLAMWQFCSVGGGAYYGCGSQNVDKNWAYAPLVQHTGGSFFHRLRESVCRLLSKLGCGVTLS